MSLTITVDFEIDFGKIQNVSSKNICDVTREFVERVNPKHKIILFIDASYLLALKYHCNEEFHYVKSWIEQIVKHTHVRIGLHIHPHWRSAEKFGGSWLFDNTIYDLQDLPVQDAAEYIESCYNVLLECSSQKSIEYFRAGGYCCTSRELYATLSGLGIKIDSSRLRSTVINVNGKCHNWNKFSQSSLDELILTRTRTRVLSALLRLFLPVKRQFEPNYWVGEIKLTQPWNLESLNMDSRLIYFTYKIRGLFGLDTVVINHPKDFSNYTRLNLWLLKR